MSDAVNHTGNYHSLCPGDLFWWDSDPPHRYFVISIRSIFNSDFTYATSHRVEITVLDYTGQIDTIIRPSGASQLQENFLSYFRGHAT